MKSTVWCNFKRERELAQRLNKTVRYILTHTTQLCDTYNKTVWCSLKK